MEEYLKSWKTTKLDQQVIDIFNRPITFEEIEDVIKNLPIKKSQDQMVSQQNCIEDLKWSYKHSYSNYSEGYKYREISKSPPMKSASC